VPFAFSRRCYYSFRDQIASGASSCAGLQGSSTTSSAVTSMTSVSPSVSRSALYLSLSVVMRIVPPITQEELSKFSIHSFKPLAVSFEVAVISCRR
jgi:hypothetical protein